MMNVKGKARETHNRFGNEESLEDWLADDEGNGKWGGHLVSVMFSCVCKVNIVTISNFFRWNVVQCYLCVPRLPSN